MVTSSNKWKNLERDDKPKKISTNKSLCNVYYSLNSAYVYTLYFCITQISVDIKPRPYTHMFRNMWTHGSIFFWFMLPVYSFTMKEYSLRKTCTPMLSYFNTKNAKICDRTIFSCMTSTHSASLGRFVPHHASAVWRKAPLHRTIFRLNLEKKWLCPSACLQVQRLTGVIFIIHCSYLVIPKLYFIEIEVNIIKGKICTVLKWRHL